jgi:hypothetical protein
MNLNEIVAKASREIAEKRDEWIITALIEHSNYKNIRNLHKFIIENDVKIKYNPKTKNSELYIRKGNRNELIGIFKEELDIINEEEGFRYGTQYWVKKLER